MRFDVQVSPSRVVVIRNGVCDTDTEQYRLFLHDEALRETSDGYRDEAVGPLAYLEVWLSGVVKLPDLRILARGFYDLVERKD